jgi:hypothetical protein
MLPFNLSVGKELVKGEMCKEHVIVILAWSLLLLQEVRHTISLMCCTQMPISWPWTR